MIFEKTKDDLGEISEPPRFRNLELAPMAACGLWAALAFLADRL
jgi:hypothetical protein